MSYTNTTSHLKLPQWKSTDLPTWDSDLNGAFSNLDNRMTYYPQNRMYITLKEPVSTAATSISYSFTSAQQRIIEDIYTNKGNIYLLITNSATSSTNTHHQTFVHLYSGNAEYYDFVSYFNLAKVVFAQVPAIHCYSILMPSYSSISINAKDATYSSDYSVYYFGAYLFLEY